MPPLRARPAIFARLVVTAFMLSTPSAVPMRSRLACLKGKNTTAQGAALGMMMHTPQPALKGRNTLVLHASRLTGPAVKTVNSQPARAPALVHATVLQLASRQSIRIG